MKCNLAVMEKNQPATCDFFNALQDATARDLRADCLLQVFGLDGIIPAECQALVRTDDWPFHQGGLLF